MHPRLRDITPCFESITSQSILFSYFPGRVVESFTLRSSGMIFLGKEDKPIFSSALFICNSLSVLYVRTSSRQELLCWRLAMKIKVASDLNTHYRNKRLTLIHFSYFDAFFSKFSGTIKESLVEIFIFFAKEGLGFINSKLFPCSDI